MVFLILLVCLFSGCINDPITGNWISEDGEIKASFDSDKTDSDKTFTIEIGLFKTSGQWEKFDDGYILYSGETPVGTAYFSGSRLHIDMGSGLLSISDLFIKQK